MSTLPVRRPEEPDEPSYGSPLERLSALVLLPVIAALGLAVYAACSPEAFPSAIPEIDLVVLIGLVAVALLLLTAAALFGLR
jgi:hypothetical protein